MSVLLSVALHFKCYFQGHFLPWALRILEVGVPRNSSTSLQNLSSLVTLSGTESSFRIRAHTGAVPTQDEIVSGGEKVRRWTVAMEEHAWDGTVMSLHSVGRGGSGVFSWHAKYDNDHKRTFLSKKDFSRLTNKSHNKSKKGEHWRYSLCEYITETATIPKCVLSTGK